MTTFSLDSDTIALLYFHLYMTDLYLEYPLLPSDYIKIDINMFQKNSA